MITIFAKMKSCSLLILLIILSVTSCVRKSKELKTESGMRYILYTDSAGENIKKGDYVTMQMIYSDANDSVLYDSRDAKIPVRFQLNEIPFPGSFEEGLTYLSINDSASFFVPADSMYMHLYSSGTRMEVKQIETAFKPGTFVKFDVKILNVQDYVEAEQEIEMQLSQKQKQEKFDIEKYIAVNNITVTPDSSGYYLIIKERGKGSSVDSGKIIGVEYDAKFLDGTLFDGTSKTGKEYRFISGTHRVIKGWEIAMKDLCQGDIFTLLVPSHLAYGEEGIRNPDDGTYIVPPYTPLVFNIRIVTVEDAPPVSNR
jgi:FKBP-type peptidyl-prolyl cis-trans isomerase FkpA